MQSAQPLPRITVLPFPAFLQRVRACWWPGRHIAIIAPSGKGKSWLAHDVLSLRKYAVLLTIKMKDDTTKRYSDYKMIRRWADRRINQKHVLYWPQVKHLREVKEVQDEVYGMLDSIFVGGGWAICFDDLRVLCDQMGLRRELATMYVFCRSNKTSLIGLYQRPAFVCPEALSQCDLWFVFKINSDEDVVTIAKAAGTDPDVLRMLNRKLGPYDFVMLSTDFEPAIVRRERAA